MNAPRLSAQGLTVQLGGRTVLDAVSLDLDPGWTAIVGRNGAGKSTLLRALAGLLPHSGGSVHLAGRPLASASARERGRQIAWLAQQGEAQGDLTVREVVALGRLPHLGLLGAATADDDAIVEAALAATECTEWAQRRLHELSGGERQRALIARVLAVQAPVLLLDEPTAHLDPPHQVALVKLFATLAREHTVVSVMHDLSLALRADRLVLLHDGRVRARGAGNDPHVHAAIEAVFEGSVRIERVGAHHHALPNLPA